MAQPARTHSFASLLGFGKKPAAAADPLAARVDTDKDDDSEEKKKKEGESDEDYAKRMDALDAKKAKAAKTESDKDKTGDDDEKAKAAAMTERARCASIVAHGINCGAVRQACVYAFDTSLSVEEANRSVDATVLDREAAAPAAASSPSLAMRMARETVPVVHDDGGVQQPEVGSVKATIAAATAAMAKAMGKSPTA